MCQFLPKNHWRIFSANSSSMTNVSRWDSKAKGRAVAPEVATARLWSPEPSVHMAGDNSMGSSAQLLCLVSLTKLQTPCGAPFPLKLLKGRFLLIKLIYMTKWDLITPIHFSNTSLWLEKGNFSNCSKQDWVALSSAKLAQGNPSSTTHREGPSADFGYKQAGRLFLPHVYCVWYLLQHCKT